MIDSDVTVNAALWAWFAGWGVALAVVDIREHRLPNAMVAAAFLGCVALTGALAVMAADPGVVLRALAASLVAVGVFAVAHILGGMGMGDVKYAAVTGWALGTIGWSAVWWGHLLGFVAALGTIGWSAVWWGHLLGFVAAGGIVAVGMVASRIHRRTAVPFGPFMGLGSLIVGIAAIAPAIAPAIGSGTGG